MPDDGLFVEERLSYEGLISKICMTLGWDPAHVKLHLYLIFDSPGGRRVAKIKNDSHVEFMNRVDPMSCLDLYIDLEDITQEEREASLENVSFGDFRRGERASTSRNRDEEETPLFAQNDYGEESDSDYIAPSESEEDCDVSGESDFEESDDESKMGNWDASCVDKDEFALKMWDETPEGMDIGVCFKSQSEAKHAVKLWNIHHKREYTVAASSPRTWAMRCRTFNVESEDGEPPCEWKMRVSLKAHGLHEIVRWHDAHNCMTPVNDNDNRIEMATPASGSQYDYQPKHLHPGPIQDKMLYRQTKHRSQAVYENRIPDIKTFRLKGRSNTSIYVLGPVEDLDRCSRYDWGSALWAGLYSGLCEASQYTMHDATGCLYLLQVWAYERIERIAPQRKGVDYLLDETAPLAQRYTYGDAPRSSTPPFRDQLTSLRVEDFRWQPYAHVLHRLPDFCTQGQAIWTTRCWMFCWAIREPHESGRVVRQFGYIQDVPKRPMIKDNAVFLFDHAHSMSGYLSNNWEDHHSAVRRHWNRREEFVLRDLEEGDPGSVYEGYYEWFMVNPVRLISNPGNYEPQGYETSSSRVKLYGEVLNNIRVSTERFREKREDDNLLDEELDKHLDDIINQTHAALTLGANDEMEVDDTQILVDEDPFFPSQPPPGKKAKPWSRDKIGGGRKRKVTIPPRTSQQQTEGQQNEDQAHSSRGSRIQVETHFEEAGGPETQFDIGGPETQFDIGGPETQFGRQSQPQPGVKFITMGESQSQPQIEAQFGGQSQPHQSSILTYLKRGDRIRQGPNKYTPDAHNKGKGKK
ncbi:OLC1v1018718C1 [Oldenlandia corymbosa var. corymbosa]|uniref:OLC1v1018718C1 n=1 Tax=Oldenlandia corymbosa var. corymbosa TaxID=529605 RepID=A0AAV1ECE2_OLDCO|nr:OLC1v1018718C1 [Oldenlandia corymbosa var. corymbosa]